LNYVDINNRVHDLRSRSLEALLSEAWNIRNKNFKSTIAVSAPSPKRYHTDHFKNRINTFTNISLTGTNCALNCEHCNRQLLSSMIPAKTPERLIDVGDKLIQKGFSGVLLSGGANAEGEVSFDVFLDSIKHLKNIGLKVIVHTGLINKSTAKKLKEAGVDQALIDVIGDDETIKNVYHLNKTVENYQQSLFALKNAGLNVAPHIVIGLNFGKITGEFESIKMISVIEPDVIVLVILSPIYGTPMYGISVPDVGEIARIAAIARIVNPHSKITLGCARPTGPEKIKIEKLMVNAGVNGIAYAMDETINHAEGLGLNVEYNELCCSLIGI
jgi:uncharacterized radical SAM superfamily protein